MSVEVEYQHLERRPGSNYRQFFVKGRRIRAEDLYRKTVGLEPRTPEEVARDYGLPVEVVLESVDYAIRHKDLLDAERTHDDVRTRQLGLDQPPYVPVDRSE